MSRTKSATTLAWEAAYKRAFKLATIHAAHLQAKHRVITARLAQGRKQLPLEGFEAA